jgi:hypothetical protein
MDEFNFNNEPDKLNFQKPDAETDSNLYQKNSNDNFGEQQFNNQNYDPYNQYQQKPTASQYGMNQSYQPNQQQGYYSQPQQSYGQPVQNNQYIQQPYGQPQNIYQQYPQNPYGAAAAVYPNSGKIGMAIASLVLGICSIVFGIFMFVFFPLALAPIIGLILGIVFKCKHLPNGKGISTAGIITSSIGIVLPIIFIIVLILNMNKAMDFIEKYNPEQYQQMYDEYYDDFPEWFDSIQIQNLMK